MHIQEGTNTTLTTCTKMTEEVDRRHGVNGNSSSKGVTEDAPQHDSDHSLSGGRLKFFKDGKFILELVRGAARAGERPGWVSVPRKTFWPPAAPAAPAAAAVPPLHPRLERAASLSVSDDNSSVQSSPWQRDHCWKQTSPRRNISKELTFFYCRPSTLHTPLIEAASRAKRRRPHHAPPPPPPHDAAVNGARRSATNGVCEPRRNGDVTSPDRGEDAVDGPRAHAVDDRWHDYDREKYYHMKLKKPYQYHKLRVYKKTKPSIRSKKLLSTVDRLREKMAALPAPVNAKLASCRQQEHAMVSPRKRILRELERVTLEEQGNKRRAKTAPALASSAAPAAGPSARREPSPRHNGAARRSPALSKNSSSYSIHSLLSMGEERRSPAAAAAVKPEPAASPEPGRYRYAVLGSPGGAGSSLGSPGSARDDLTPPYRYASPYPLGAVPPVAAAWRRDDPRDPYLVYPYPLYRPAAPLWLHYPPPWPPAPIEHLKDDPAADLPLNLSKH